FELLDAVVEARLLLTTLMLVIEDVELVVIVEWTPFTIFFAGCFDLFSSSFLSAEAGTNLSTLGPGLEDSSDLASTSAFLIATLSALESDLIKLSNRSSGDEAVEDDETLGVLLPLFNNLVAVKLV